MSKITAGPLTALAGAGGSVPADLPSLIDPADPGDREDSVRPLGTDLVLVLASDLIAPVGDDPFLYGQVAAAHVLARLFARGALPVAAQALAVWPEGLTATAAAAILAGARATAGEAGCPVAPPTAARGPELLFGLAVTGTA